MVPLVVTVKFNGKVVAERTSVNVSPLQTWEEVARSRLETVGATGFSDVPLKVSLFRTADQHDSDRVAAAVSDHVGYLSKVLIKRARGQPVHAASIGAFLIGFVSGVTFAPRRAVDRHVTPVLAVLTALVRRGRIIIILIRGKAVAPAKTMVCAAALSPKLVPQIPCERQIGFAAASRVQLHDLKRVAAEGPDSFSGSKDCPVNA